MKILKKIAIILVILFLILIIFCINIDNKSSICKEIQKRCNIETIEYDGRNVFILTPKGEKRSDMVILYLHGGSYMGAMTNEHWNLYNDLINDLGCTIVAPDYPLTPKYNYKDVENMMYPFYEEFIEKLNTENFIFMGDSAGGGLALAITQKAGKDNLKLPKRLILISPWLDVRLENPEIDEVQKRDPILIKTTLKLAGEIYAGKDGINSEFVNPIDGYINNLPEITIYTGTNDILNPDVHKFVERLNNNGINIDIRETQGAVHIWILKREKGKQEYKSEEGYQDLMNLLRNI